MLKRNPRRDINSYKRLASKPPEQGKRRKPMRVRGASNRSKERAKWQRELIQIYGYGEFCEWLGGCSNTFGIANAHRLKKTKITTREEYVHGRAHLCQMHHQSLDEATGEDVHARMYDVITQIIRERDDRNEQDF